MCVSRSYPIASYLAVSFFLSLSHYFPCSLSLSLSLPLYLSLSLSLSLLPLLPLSDSLSLSPSLSVTFLPFICVSPRHSALQGENNADDIGCVFTHDTVCEDVQSLHVALSQSVSE